MVDIIIFDWKRTLYDPDRKVLIKGAVEILDLMKSKNIPMVTNLYELVVLLKTHAFTPSNGIRCPI